MPAPARVEIAPGEPEPIRAFGIIAKRHSHEFRCVEAWRAREHPAWSQFHSDFRVVPRLRRVRT